MSDETTTTETEATTETETLEQYKQRVYKVALELKRRFDWCDEETDEYLARLDLPAVPQRRLFRFAATTTADVTYDLTTYTEDEAREQVQRLFEQDKRRASQSGRGPTYGRVRSLSYGELKAVPIPTDPDADEVSEAF